MSLVYVKFMKAKQYVAGILKEFMSNSFIHEKNMLRMFDETSTSAQISAKGEKRCFTDFICELNTPFRISLINFILVLKSLGSLIQRYRIEFYKFLC